MTFINRLKGFSLEFTDKATKNLEQLEKQTARKIDTKLSQLIAGAQGLDIKRLVDYQEPTYRLRAGDYRIIFKIFNDKIVVLVISIIHRKDAY